MNDAFTERVCQSPNESVRTLPKSSCAPRVIFVKQNSQTDQQHRRLYSNIFVCVSSSPFVRPPVVASLAFGFSVALSLGALLVAFARLERFWNRKVVCPVNERRTGEGKAYKSRPTLPAPPSSPQRLRTDHRSPDAYAGVDEPSKQQEDRAGLCAHGLRHYETALRPFGSVYAPVVDLRHS